MNMKETILREACRLISDKRRWCRYSSARDDHNQGVGPSHAKARKWSAAGALEYCSPTIGLYRAAYDLLLVAAGDLYRSRVDFVNDELGHDAVLVVYRQAIELARREGPGKAMAS